MDSQKVKIVEGRFGKGIVATEPIHKDEAVAKFDGSVYEVENATDLPPEAINHAVQVGLHTWRDSAGIARLMNHSCEPNVGYKGLYTLVAMRDIAPGEELLLDYDMSENSDWRMDCLCGTPSCRKTIGSFDALPEATKAKYNGYISAWLE